MNWEIWKSCRDLRDRLRSEVEGRNNPQAFLKFQ